MCGGESDLLGCVMSAVTSLSKNPLEMLDAFVCSCVRVA